MGSVQTSGSHSNVGAFILESIDADLALLDVEDPPHLQASMQAVVAMDGGGQAIRDFITMLRPLQGKGGGQNQNDLASILASPERMIGVF